MQVFIVRPFGDRLVSKKNKEMIEQVKFNFDKVEKELIRPAMNATNLLGGTTGEIFEAGDIRDDMFSLLLLADVVIADITIHNANVFYELGIRHALRDKKTILIKCAGYDDTPFDIIGYRYLTYDKDDPASSLRDLIRMIEETKLADRKDSPVFNVLPGLRPQDTESFQVVPADFVNEFEEAVREKDFGKIMLLRHEVNECSWKLPALRLIGKVLFWDFELYNLALEVMEEIQQAKPDDIQANDWLSTIYQRLAAKQKDVDKRNSLLDRSDSAIKRLIAQRNLLDTWKLAEVYALKARNLKMRWSDAWQGIDDVGARQQKALLSLQLLVDSIQDYTEGFDSNLNHYYSGINALCLTVLLLDLGRKNISTWNSLFESDDEAEKQRVSLEKSKVVLFVLLERSVSTELKRLDYRKRAETDPDVLEKIEEALVWARLCEADQLFLKTDAAAPAERVVNKYRAAVVNNTQQFNLTSALGQLKLFKDLELKSPLAQKIVEAFNIPETIFSKHQHVIVFTGHMIDRSDRPNGRFPARMEGAVKQEIKNVLLTEIKKKDVKYCGLAGGACGGDILFHEVCRESEIQTTLFLALPRDQFVGESVSFAGNGWVERFNQLFETIGSKVLSQSKDLPRWLRDKKDYSIWERNNLWELNSALIHSGINVTLLALWDGKHGDGPGGTEHMIEIAKKAGAKTVVIDINAIAG